MVNDWDGIKAGVVERLVVFQHTVDGMEQLAHDGADGLQRFLAIGYEMPEVGADMRVMLFGAQGGHIQPVDTVLKVIKQVKS